MNWIIFIIGFLACCWISWLVFKKDTQRAVPYPLLTASLRMLSFILLLIILSAHKITFQSKLNIKPNIIVLDDRSTSITKLLRKDTNKIKEEIKSLQNNLGDQFKMQHYYFDQTLSINEKPYKGEATNISDALQEVCNKNTDQNVQAVVLISDGQYNEGSAPSALSLAINAPIYCLAIGDTNTIADVSVSKLYYNKIALLQNIFEIKADIKFQQVSNQTFTITLKEKNVVLQSKTISCNIEDQIKTIAFLQKASEEGIHAYSIEVTPAKNEINTQNNQQRAVIQIKAEKKQIGIIADAPHPDMQAVIAALDKNKSFQFLSFIGKSPTDKDLDRLSAAIFFYPKQTTWKLISKKIPTWLFITGKEAGFTGTETNKINPTSSISFNKQFTLFEINAQAHNLSAQLPPLQQHFNTLPSFANAEVLAYQGSSPIWLFEPQTPYHIICLGEGLWKWRMYEYKNSQSHTLVDELIQNTLSILTQQERNKKLSVHPIKDAFSNNENISFVGSLDNELHRDEQAAIKLSIQSKNKILTTVLMQRNGASLQAAIGRLEEGEYAYTAKTTLNGILLEDKGNFMVDDIRVEDLTNTANWDELQTLSNNNKGFATTLGNINSIIDSIKNRNYKTIIKSQESSNDIIDFKWLFFLALLLLSTEWIIRKYWMAQ